MRISSAVYCAFGNFRWDFNLKFLDFVGWLVLRIKFPRMKMPCHALYMLHNIRVTRSVFEGNIIYINICSGKFTIQSSAMAKRCIHQLSEVYLMLVLCLLLTQCPELVNTFVMTSSGQTVQLCVCSRHTNLFIYPTTNENGRPIGVMYTDDCKLFTTKATELNRDFLPVIHDHQV